MGEKRSFGVNEDVEVVTMRWPEPGATDEQQARVLAENMAENGGIGREVADVYAFREVFEFSRGETATELGITEDAVDKYLYQGRKRVREARGLMEAIEVAGDRGEGYERQTITTEVPLSEYRLMHDVFDSAVAHDRGESLAGNLYADREREEVAGVFVREQAGERTSDGALGYIVEHLAPNGESLGAYAVAAEYMVERIEKGELVEARLSLEPIEE